MQNGQTEPAGVCPEVVRVYDEWFGLFIVKNIKTEELAKQRRVLSSIQDNIILVFDGLR